MNNEKIVLAFWCGAMACFLCGYTIHCIYDVKRHYNDSETNTVRVQPKERDMLCRDLP